MRTPHDGIQPQAAVDSHGTVHLIYYKGEPSAGDIFYVRRDADAGEFSSPLRVNSHPGSAVAMGTIRGAQLAIGKSGRVHVVWNGSTQAEPRAADPQHDTPMLYTRLNDSGDGFEAQRNLIQHAFGLDGGGSVAADPQGNVYVLWHANGEAGGEGNRRVYLATSRNEGATFSREEPISAPGTGVCGCCGMKAHVDSRGRLLVLYRSATDLVGRHMYLITSDDAGRTFDSRIVDRWEVAQCPMSSATFAEAPEGVVAGWETADQVFFGWSRGGGSIADTTAASGSAAAHPAAAINHRGEAIFVWAEGTGWNRGGAVGWQVYDGNGSATGEKGTRQGIPTWSFATAFATPDGGFTIVY